SARIALGGVAQKPWRANAAETLLVGRSVQELSGPWLAQVGAAALQGAQPHRGNAFKIPMGQRAVVRAIRVAAGIERPSQQTTQGGVA
ncbi:MAG: FAD binding domain-containing protein, partial [Janthinobacterium lividum]